MNVRLLAGFALSSILLAACSPGGGSGATATAGGAGGAGGNASGDFCTIAQSVVNDQDAVAGAIRDITRNTVSGPDASTPEGWTKRQELAQAAVDAAQALIDQYSAGLPLIDDPAVADAWGQVSQFYADSVLAGNQDILAAPDQATYLTSGTGGDLTVAPTDAQILVQTYISDTCGFLTPNN